MIGKFGPIAHGENVLVSDAIEDDKKQDKRELREQIAHPYITRQHLKPPRAKEESPSEDSQLKGAKPCD